MTAATPASRGGAGSPLVLLHGLTDTWRAWTPVLTALEAEHDVYAPTLPGHAGARPFHGAMSWGALVDAIDADICEQFDHPVHVVGSSLGGWLALELAARGRTASVVAICPSGGWERDSGEGQRVARYFKRTGRLLELTSRYADTITRSPRLKTLALRDYVAYPRRVPAESAATMLRAAAACQIRDAIVTMQAREHFRDLEPIACPVRIAWGTADRILPPRTCSVRLRRTLPDAEFIELPGLGHLPMWDDPGAVTQTIVDVTSAATHESSDGRH